MALPKLKPTAQPFTYADYCQWPDNERWELINGEAYAMAPAPAINHQMVTGQLFRQIDEALDGAPCRALIAPVDVLLPATGENEASTRTVVQPDILVVCDPSKITERNILGAPDWIIEVLSPSTARHDHLTKRQLYEAAGVREYWLVHPVDRIVTIYTLVDGHYAGPEIIAMADQRACTIIPEIIINWQPILDKLPPDPALEEGVDAPGSGG